MTTTHLNLRVHVAGLLQYYRSDVICDLVSVNYRYAYSVQHPDETEQIK